MGNNGLDTAAALKVRNWSTNLSNAVRSAFARGNSLPLLVRVGVPAENVNPYAWLAARRFGDRVIWQARHHNKLRAMCGSVVSFDLNGDGSLESLRHKIDRFLSRPGDDMRFFGGLRFDPARAPDEVWADFGKARFILPRFELHTRGSHSQIYCNLVFPEDTDALEEILLEIDRLDHSLPAFQDPISAPVSRSDTPDRDGWTDRIDHALSQFQAGPLEKVVLARRTDFQFTEPVSAFNLLQRLAAATPNCFHFYFESNAGEAFLGATPERLFYQNGLQIDSEAVAGTRPRGETEDVDEEFRAALLASEKDRREHAFVRDSIEAALRDYCESVTVDHEASEMRLARGRHLVSRISGVLSRPVSAFELIHALHPTPAVGGNPTRVAVEAIEAAESFDRGWYAGPVGWIGRDSAEFAVALRCGVVRESVLSLFSGAGIVEGSVPDLEWAEIEQKIVDFVNVIGLELQSYK